MFQVVHEINYAVAKCRVCLDVKFNNFPLTEKTQMDNRDPAGLYFQTSADAISKTDAVNAQVIQRNDGQMGMQRQAGTIDFYLTPGSTNIQ